MAQSVDSQSEEVTACHEEAKPEKENASHGQHSPPNAHFFELSRLAKLCQPLDMTHADRTEGSARRRLMMRYYTAKLVFMLTTNVENNCFLSG